MKVLIIEDDHNLRLLIKNFLERYKYLTEEATDGKEGYQKIITNEYDCILLDLNLPNLDGIEVAKKARSEGIHTPIIMLTARSQIYNKIEGFDTGADDYITKPFDMKELVARIRALIRRSSSNKNNVLEFAKQKVNVNNNTIEAKTNGIVKLSNKEMSILEYLIRNEQKIISAEELLEHVWDREVNMFSDTVKTHIKTLRKKVDKDKKYIKTIKGKGYIYNG